MSAFVGKNKLLLIDTGKPQDKRADRSDSKTREKT